MNKIFYISFIIFAIFIEQSLSANKIAPPSTGNTKVVMINIMFRHGVRSWLQDYPFDQTPTSHWDQFGGFGQLTDAGFKQLNEFGKFFKNYYKDKIVFSLKNTFAKSTDYNRTFNSVRGFINGTFDRQEMYIERTPKAYDSVLTAYSNNCPRYDQLKAQMRNSTSYLNLQNSKAEFLKNMSNLSGINLDKPLNYYQMWQIADNYLVNEANGLPIQQWIKDNIKEIMFANDYTFFIDFVTTEMGKLVSGTLLYDIISRINNKVSGHESRNLFIYGIHDNYMAAMQKLLGYSKVFTDPHFATSYIFELRQRLTSKQYFIRVLHKNDLYPFEKIEFKPVTIAGCTQFCPLETFLKLTVDKVVPDFRKACVSL